MVASANCLIALHRGSRSLISRFIRWQTRSQYSHASFYFPGYGIIEAREGKGVQFLPGFELQEGEVVDLFHIAGLTDAQAQGIKEWAISQLGKPYDYTMVLRFISRRQETRESTGKFFCSEFIFAGVLKKGVALLARTEPCEVAPALLHKSPLLFPVVPECLRP